MAMIPPTTMMAMFMLSFPVSIPGQYQKERKEGLAAGELGGVLPNLNQTTIIPLPPISPLLLLPLLLPPRPLSLSLLRQTDKLGITITVCGGSGAKCWAALCVMVLYT